VSEASRIRRMVLVLIVISQVFSPVLFVPGMEHLGGSVFRLILLLAGAVAIAGTGFKLVGKWPRRALVAGSVLAVWMTISLTWSPELFSGLQELSYVITTLLLIYVLDVLIRDESDFFSVGRWIVILGVAVTACSYYELYTGNHFFRSSLQDIAESNRSLSYIADDLAWFTFDNPNDLVVHLAFCFFVAVPMVSGSRIGKVFLLLFFLAVAYLSELLDARIVILSLSAYTIIYGLGRLQKTPAATYMTIIGLLAAILVGLLLALRYVDAAEFIDVSTFTRLQLVKSGFIMGVHSLFIGIGSGAFEAEMWSGGFLGDTYGIINPHNAFSRMFAENGIVGLLALGYLVLGPLLTLPRAVKVSALTAFTAAVSIGLISLLSVGSDPLSASSLQLAIAFLWVNCRFMIGVGVDSASPSLPEGADALGAHPIGTPT